MSKGRRPGSHQQIKCGICRHPERGRIDFLVCSGAGVQPTAKKFGVSYDSLRNHVAKHISLSYRDAVRLGPLQSEEQLRRLVAESGAGVIENLKAIYSGLASRWLHAFERALNRLMAHFAMGVLRRVENRLSDSKIELETAIALDRNNARALQQLGLTLMWLGQPETAIPEIEKAIRLNPYDPNIASYYWALGASKLVSGGIDDAASLLEKARAANPRLFFVHRWLAAPLALREELDEAKNALAQSLKLRPEIRSLARRRAEYPWYSNAKFVALAEPTLYAGLRRVGFPEE